uniref:Uncharacterized protein n=1 Tax=Romanomermis culicivorax TaxID=13658 RepID=A0A915I4J9_ROMCU
MFKNLFRSLRFQNRRAKEKRLKKDAGRGRWTNYFGCSKSIKSSNADTVSNESFDMDLELSEDNQSNADYGDLDLVPPAWFGALGGECPPPGLVQCGDHGLFP